MNKYELKVGDTLNLVGAVEVPSGAEPPSELLTATVTSQVRDANGGLLCDLVTEWVYPVLHLDYAGDTQNWPLGKAQIDVQFNLPDGKVVSTNTATIMIMKDVTR